MKKIFKFALFVILSTSSGVFAFQGEKSFSKHADTQIKNKNNINALQNKEIVTYTYRKSRSTRTNKNNIYKDRNHLQGDIGITSDGYVLASSEKSTSDSVSPSNHSANDSSNSTAAITISAFILISLAIGFVCVIAGVLIKKVGNAKFLGSGNSSESESLNYLAKDSFETSKKKSISRKGMDVLLSNKFKDDKKGIENYKTNGRLSVFQREIVHTNKILFNKDCFSELPEMIHFPKELTNVGSNEEVFHRNNVQSTFGFDARLQIIPVNDELSRNFSDADRKDIFDDDNFYESSLYSFSISINPEETEQTRIRPRTVFRWMVKVASEHIDQATRDENEALKKRLGIECANGIEIGGDVIEHMNDSEEESIEEYIRKNTNHPLSGPVDSKEESIECFLRRKGYNPLPDFNSTDESYIEVDSLTRTTEDK